MNYTILELLGCSLLGQLIHLLIKAKAIKARNDSAGLSGNPFSELLSKDYINILLALIANVALLIFFKNTTKTTFEFNFFGVDMQFDWRYFLFIFSGYTGSSFVLSLFSKVDKLQKQELNNISILTPNKMTYIWELTLEKDTDVIMNSKGSKVSLDDFAHETSGTLDGTVITYTEDPSFSEATVFRNDTTSYVASPIRRPI